MEIPVSAEPYQEKEKESAEKNGIIRLFSSFRHSHKFESKKKNHQNSFISLSTKFVNVVSS